MKSLHLLCGVLLTAHLCAQPVSPAEFLPHAYGREFTPHHLLVAYFEHIAAESPYVILEHIGSTDEHRPMFLAIVSSPENLARIEDLRLNNLRLAGLEPGTPDPAGAKAIVWLGYSVHGNEAAGSEASLQVVYDLATGANGSHTWLGNTIVVMEPSANPDGFNRYTSWNNQVSAYPFDVDYDAREHHEPWPGGRTNHYLFDLNRDWAWQTQTESQHRVRAYMRWMPHVVADIHEMGHTSPYYFAPAAPPYHAYITDWQGTFQHTIGRNHARHFDREGWAYFTREIFDLFYPSYGDTWPVYNGAIGMTYEQGGSGRAGRAIVLPSGDTLTLADRLAHHHIASLSTVEVSSEHVQRLVTEFQAYFTRSATNPPGPFKTYVISANNGRAKIDALRTVLDRQGIRYGRAENPVRSANAYNYRTGQSQSLDISNGDLVISAYQPRAVLAQILFDPENSLADSLTYDITCWSLPYAHGLEAYALRERIGVTESYDVASAPLQELPEAYAYAVRWESLASAKVLARVLREGLRPRYATAPFAIGEEEFGAGTIVLLRADHGAHPDFFGAVASMNTDPNAPLIPLHTGFADRGRDLGSHAYQLILQPRVLTIAGDGVSVTGFGQVWHFFERVLNYPLTVVDRDRLGSVSLDAYQVLVLPEGWYSIPDKTLESIAAWISGGGRVIALGSALRLFADKDGYALKRFAEKDAADEAKKAEERERLDLRLAPYGEGERRRMSSQIPGAVFRAHVDGTHPLGFGLGDVYFTLKTSPASFEHLTGADNVVYLGDTPVHYGFAGVHALEQQKNSVIFAKERKGDGALIYMVDNPLFRGFWEQGMFAFCNAVFLR